MGHQHHFLSRLDRVSLAHVELALHLYREHELLRFILALARLPEGAERVALSLEDPVEGPFLVVTREGRFVTCLGKGMTANNLPVVTRAQLDTIAAKHDELKERIAACRALVGPGGKTTDLLVRIYEAGDELSREEVVGLMAMQPLLKREFLWLQGSLFESREKARVHLLQLLRKTRNLKPVHRRLLHEYWKAFWAITHLSVLGALGHREELEARGADIDDINTWFSSCIFMQGIVTSAVRGIWAAARIGKILLPNYKHAYVNAEAREPLLEASMVLAALGMRHAKLRAEVRKVLSATNIFKDNPKTSHMYQLAETFRNICDLAFDEPEECIEIQREIGCRMAVIMTRHRPAGAPLRFTRDEEVPQELAMTLAVNNPAEFVTETAPIKSMFMYLPWLAKAQAEDLYLPRDFVEVIHAPWAPERTFQLLDGMLEEIKIVAQAQREAAGPARKGPCPCGSGKKYKRCCGQ